MKPSSNLACARPFLALFAIAVVVRIVAALFLRHNALLAGDEPEYYEPARHLALGEGYMMVPQQSQDGIAHLTAYRAPGTALILAGSFVLFGVGVGVAHWTVVVVGSLVSPSVFGFARCFMNERSAFLSGVCAAVYPTAVFYNLGIYSEAMFIPTLLFATTLTVKALEHRRRVGWTALGAGITWGLASLFRPVAMPLSVLAALYIVLRSGWWRAVLLCIGTSLVLVPWVVRNVGAFGHPILLATEGGETMLGANNPEVLRERGLHGMWLSPMAIPEYRDHLRSIHGELERDREQNRMAIQFLRSHYHDIPRLASYKLWLWLSPITGVAGFVRAAVLTSYGALLALLVAGLLVHRFPSSPALHLTLICTVGQAVVTAVYWGGLTRGRLPLEVMWLPWAVASAIGIVRAAWCKKVTQGQAPGA